MHAPTHEGFNKVLTLSNFTDGDVDVACTANRKTRIGEIVVPAQSVWIYGRGSSVGPVELMGEIFGDLEAAGPTDLEGTLIVEAQSANDRAPVVLGEYDLARLRLGSTDPRLRVKVPLQKKVQIHEDSKLVFFLKLRTTATFDYGVSDLTLDCVQAYES